MKSQYWVNDLSHYQPINSSIYWGDSQALFGILLSGQILLTDNKSSASPDNFLDKKIGDRCYLGLYSWKDKCAELYVFDDLENFIFNKLIKEGLRSLIGVHHIKAGTPVISNTSRNILFYL